MLNKTFICILSYSSVYSCTKINNDIIIICNVQSIVQSTVQSRVQVLQFTRYLTATVNSDFKQLSVRLLGITWY